MLRRIENVISSKGMGPDYLFLIRDHAIHLELVGIVFTRDDGSIKIIAEGEEENLEKFIHEVKTRSFSHPIENFYVKWGEPMRKYKEFTTDYTHH